MRRVKGERPSQLHLRSLRPLLAAPPTPGTPLSQRFLARDPLLLRCHTQGRCAGEGRTVPEQSGKIVPDAGRVWKERQSFVHHSVGTLYIS